MEFKRKNFYLIIIALLSHLCLTGCRDEPKPTTQPVSALDTSINQGDPQTAIDAKKWVIAEYDSRFVACGEGCNAKFTIYDGRLIWFTNLETLYVEPSGITKEDVPRANNVDFRGIIKLVPCRENSPILFRVYDREGDKWLGGFKDVRGNEGLSLPLQFNLIHQGEIGDASKSKPYNWIIKGHDGSEKTETDTLDPFPYKKPESVLIKGCDKVKQDGYIGRLSWTPAETALNERIKRIEDRIKADYKTTLTLDTKWKGEIGRRMNIVSPDMPTENNQSTIVKNDSAEQAKPISFYEAELQKQHDYLSERADYFTKQLEEAKSLEKVLIEEKRNPPKSLSEDNLSNSKSVYTEVCEVSNLLPLKGTCKTVLKVFSPNKQPTEHCSYSRH